MRTILRVIRSFGLTSTIASILLFVLVHETSATFLRQLNKTELTAAEKLLVEGSKKAIIATGISEAYFNSHFKLLRVESKISDRRVTWIFTVNGYEAIVKDSIGYYTQGNSKIDTHSVSQTLGQSSEIVKTISKSRAMNIMRSCVGSFATPTIEYGPVEGRTQLFMVAEKKIKKSARELEEEREREREEREEMERRSRKQGADEIESEEGEKDLPRIVFGYVNLQTGKCTKGTGLIAP